MSSATSVAPEPLAPLKTSDLTALLPLAGLRFLVITEPRAIAETAWLIPSIGRVAPEAGLSAFAAAKGFDLRQIPQALIASYEGQDEGPDATLSLVRHNAPPKTIEKLFRARITRGEKRAVDRPDVIRTVGTLGTTSEALALIGRDVAAFQEGGSLDRGPLRIATLYAMGRLERSPTALSAGPLRTLDERLGKAPAKALVLGPFEGDLARGLRGLLEGSTAVGAAASPTSRETLAVTLVATGDFTTDGQAAAGALLAAWNDVAAAPLGHLLSLGKPSAPPRATYDEDSITLRVELDADALFEGLAAATSTDVAELFR